jgi:hypothetical protein
MMRIVIAARRLACEAGVMNDYDAKEEVVGVEILFLSKRGVDTDKLDFQTLRAPSPDEVVVRETPPPYGKPQ